jgi:hypothetical protein
MKIPVERCTIIVKALIINRTRNHWRCKMRIKRTGQMSIYETFAKHEIADELKKISNWLDTHTEVLDWVEADIQRKELKATGRIGMTIESILRSGFLLRY